MVSMYPYNRAFPTAKFTKSRRLRVVCMVIEDKRRPWTVCMTILNNMQTTITTVTATIIMHILHNALTLTAVCLWPKFTLSWWALAHAQNLIAGILDPFKFKWALIGDIKSYCVIERLGTYTRRPIMNQHMGTDTVTCWTLETVRLVML